MKNNVIEAIRMLSPLLIEAFAIIVDEPHMLTFAVFAIIWPARNSKLNVKKNVLCFLMTLPTSIIANIYILSQMVFGPLSLIQFIIYVYIFSFADILAVLFIYAQFFDRSYKA